MKMHNDPHSWQGWLELFQSWWRGDTPLGAVSDVVIYGWPAYCVLWR
ncbi:phage holin, lambda family [Salmonella enterica subsp. enterica]|uniref:Phage holin, lambda family n=1 Tax=Salmonella enterica I TaxID=59201 RepID=A0A379UNG9_SALET|nr:phage holin, lambda family [Salmonella enterica subsp. enterica]